MPAFDAIATRVLQQIPRIAVADRQRRLADAQTEATTGRHADVGLTLGHRTGVAIGLRLELDAGAAGVERAKQAAARAGVTQSVLSSISGIAQDFQSMLAGARNAENGTTLAATTARSSMEALQTALSATYGGQYIFGGLMVETVPLNPYSTGPRQGIIDAFQTNFGFLPTSPSAAALTAADVTGFLDGAFDSLFEDATWTSVWSNASNQGPVFRIGSNDSLDLQANANQPFARTLAKAFSMIEALGSGNLNQGAFQAVVDRALSLVTTGQLQVGTEQARIGAGESRLKSAIEAMDAARARTTSAIQALEAVDPYEAATRVNLLMTQLETSYALTGRINRMSLLSYI